MQSSFASYYIQCWRVVAYDKESQTLKNIDQNREQLGLEPRLRKNEDLLEKFV